MSLESIFPLRISVSGHLLIECVYPELGGSAALLAARLSLVSCGLHATLARLLGAAPPAGAERARREHVAVLREQNDALRARHVAGI